MSGHSKWATTKHKKAVLDGRRAKLFAKLIKNIEVARPRRKPYALRRRPKGSQELTP
jgi:transcriptional/translational regulatory protein YebC/TACO1